MPSRREPCGSPGGARLVLLPGVGYLCNLEAPGRFNSEVRSFLRSVQNGER
jgi:pimeloyl-ACP methyl ester carboxylesterase